DPVNELHLPFPLLYFLVGEDPDIGGDTGVVEHVGREGDDCFEQVALEYVAPNLALATPGTAGEEGGAVEDDADTPAVAVRVVRIVVAHFADQVHQKEERPVADAREARTEAAIEPLQSVF